VAQIPWYPGVAFRRRTSASSSALSTSRTNLLKADATLAMASPFARASIARHL
jgi:hypothetical protein